MPSLAALASATVVCSVFVSRTGASPRVELWQTMRCGTHFNQAAGAARLVFAGASHPETGHARDTHPQVQIQMHAIHASLESECPHGWTSPRMDSLARGYGVNDCGPPECDHSSHCCMLLMIRLRSSRRFSKRAKTISMIAPKIIPLTYQIQVCSKSTAAYQRMLKRATHRNIEPNHSIDRILAAIPKRIPRTDKNASTIGSQGAFEIPWRKISLVEAT